VVDDLVNAVDLGGILGRGATLGESLDRSAEGYDPAVV
jgi:hypothetical protein